METNGILYKSTRSGLTVTSSQAILMGLGKDGGLFVPSRMPEFDFGPDEMADFSYQELAFRVMRLLLTDFTEEELKACIAGAYDSKFDVKEIVLRF